RHRVVDVEAFALALSLFVGMAEEEGIFGHGVAVKVENLHVTAPVEDLLRAIAVMVVDIEDGDPCRALVAEPLRHDGCVVDVAIASHEGVAGMVSGRTAERKGAAVAILDQGGST